MAPENICNLSTVSAPSRSLRSACSLTLYQPCCKLKTMGGRSFSCITPRLWDSLPPPIRNAPSFGCFKKLLTTYLLMTLLSYNHTNCCCHWCYVVNVIVILKYFFYFNFFCFFIMLLHLECKKGALQIQCIIIIIIITAVGCPGTKVGPWETNNTLSSTPRAERGDKRHI